MTSDTNPRFSSKRGSITRGLIFWFIALSVVPLFIVSWIGFHHAQASLLDSAKDRLKSTDFYHKRLIQNWFDYRFMDASHLAKSKFNKLFLQDLVIGLKSSKLSPADYVASDDWNLRVAKSSHGLDNFKNNYDYVLDILLTDNSGNLLYSTSRNENLTGNLVSGAYSQIKLAKSIQKIINQPQIDFSGIEFYSLEKKLLIGFISVPIYDKEKFVGTLSLKIKLEKVINFLTLQNKITSLTSYLIDQEGFLQTPVGSNKKDVIKIKPQNRLMEYWQKKNLEGRSYQGGILRYTGVNGKEVLGIVDSLKVGNKTWALISEIDYREIIFESLSLAKIEIIVFIIAVIIVLVVATYVAKRVSNPIIKLTENISLISQEEEDSFHAIDLDNEIGQLSDVFERMLDMQNKNQVDLKKSNHSYKEALEKLEEQKHAIDQHALITVTNIEGTITSVNEKFIEVSGYSKEELIGNNHRMLNSGHHSELFFKQMYQEIFCANVWHGEICNKEKDGSFYWVDTTIIPFTDESNNPISFIAIRTDITERKKSELEMRETFSILDYVLEASEDGILITDANNHVVKINQRFVHLWQIPEDLIYSKNSKRLIEYCQKKIIDTEKNSFENFVNYYSQEVVRVNEEVSLINGSVYQCELTSLMLDGQYCGNISTFKNITRKLQLEKEQIVKNQAVQLKLSTARILSDHLELKHRLNMLLQLLFRFDLVKDGAAAIFLLEEDDDKSISKSLKLFCDFGKITKNDWSKLQDVDEVVETKKSLVRKLSNSFVEDFEGDFCHYSLPIISQLNSNDMVLGVLVVLTDCHDESENTLVTLNEISDMLAATLIQDNANRLLKQASDLAERNSQLKSEFLASMSHEIRTPINGVIGMLELLNKSSLNVDQQHKVSLARFSAQSLLELINDILDFSKIEAGKINLEFVEFDLLELLGDIAESMALNAQKEGIEVILDTTQLKVYSVKSDPGRIRQVITNLISNGIKFTHEGEIVIVAKSLFNEKNELLFECSVKDSGIGIDSKKVDGLFKSFTQADASTTRKYGGTGLGLSICKKLCLLMGGNISVTSQLGQGSCFKIVLPVKNIRQEKDILPDFSKNNLSVLIIDDKKTSSNVLFEQIKRWGVDVTVANNVQDGFDLYQDLIDINLTNENITNQSIVVLIDGNSSAFNGIDLAKKIEQVNTDFIVKIMMMMSFSDENKLKVLSDLNINFFLKPATSLDLQKALIIGENSHSLSQDNKKALQLNAKSLDKLLFKEEIKLLLVEDNFINQQVALGILDDLGFKIDIAENGLEALERLRIKGDDFYQLILMDCQMPEMDGYDTTRAIRNGEAGKKNKTIKIIAMTANAMQYDKQKCLDAGMDDYLSKPVNPQMLIMKLKQYLIVPDLTEPDLIKSKLANSAGTDETIDESNNEPVELTMTESSSNEKFSVVWDKNAALQRVMGKEVILQKLVASFLKEMPPRIEELKSLQFTDLAQIGSLAHTIKGVSGNMSGLILQGLAAELEKEAKDENKVVVEQIMPRLFEAYKNLLACFEEYVAENKVTI